MVQVKPYHFDFVCNVKKRWEGMNVIDVFAREFPARPRSYYEEAYRDGRLRVEGTENALQGAAASRPLQQSQRMRHLIHRHEPPVLDVPIPVLGLSDDVVAVGKPATLPVHVSGQYRKNTVLGVLQADRPDLGRLLPVHRLDKAVSGVLLFARSPQAAEALRVRIEAHNIEKVYIARVLGVFPAECITVDVALSWDPKDNHVTAVPDGPRVSSAEAHACADPASTGEPMQPTGKRQLDDAPDVLCGGSPTEGNSDKRQKHDAVAESSCGAVATGTQSVTDGASGRAVTSRHASTSNGSKGSHTVGARVQAKPALTSFRRLAVSPDQRTSIVECRPKTGRTHQIRVHLQQVGHPIANDRQYGGTYPGPDRPGASRPASGAQPQPHAAAKQSQTPLPAISPSKSHLLAFAPPSASDGGWETRQVGPASSNGAAAAQPSERLPSAADAGVVALKAVQECSWDLQSPCAAAEGCSTTDEGCSLAEAFVVPPEMRDDMCPHCPSMPPQGYHPQDLRPLWLHACKYSCDAWSYECQPPTWAQVSWTPDAADVAG